MKYYNCLFFFFTLLWVQAIAGPDQEHGVIVLHDEVEVPLVNNLDLLDSPHQKIPFQDILKSEDRLKFKSANEFVDLGPGDNHWARVILKNARRDKQLYALNLGHVDLAMVYVVSNDKSFYTEQTGEFTARKLRMPMERVEHNVFLNMNPGETLTLYINFNVMNKQGFSPEVELMTMSSWLKKSYSTLFFQLIFQGILLIIFLINLAFFLLKRDRSIMFLSMYSLVTALYFMWFYGLLQVFVLPQTPHLNSYFWTLSIFSAAFFMQFIRYLFDFPTGSAYWNRIFKGHWYFSIGLFVLVNLLYGTTMNFGLSEAVADIYLLSSCVVGVLAVYKQDKSKKAHVQLFIYGAYLLAACLTSGILLVEVFNIAWGAHLIQGGVLLQFVMMILAVGSKIYLQEFDRRMEGERIIELLKIDVAKKMEEQEELTETLRAKSGELKNKESELSEKIKEIERFNEELGKFAYVASHDLKTPLRGISSIAHFILKDYEKKLGEEGQKYFELLQERTKRMNALIEGLNQYLRVGSSDANTRFSLRAVVDEAIGDLAVDNKVMIANKLEDLVIEANRTDLLYLFKGLIENAVAHNRKELKYVEVGSKPGSGDPVFYVEDNGIGIEAQYHDKIFNMFEVLDGNSGRTGIGLSIAHKIVKQNQGEIWLESKPDKGTTFYFTLSAIALGARNLRVKNEVVQ